MREGGLRRVRTQVGDPDFGYPEKRLPRIFETTVRGQVSRRLQREWLMDVEVELLSVETKLTRTERFQRWLGLESLMDKE